MIFFAIRSDSAIFVPQVDSQSALLSNTILMTRTMNTDIAIATIMSRELVTVAPETSLTQIKHTFDNHTFHHLPVVQAGGKLVGIISKEDFARAAYMLSLNTTGQAYSQLEYASLSANDIMTIYPVFLEPQDTVGLAADIFLANKFHALPILDEGQLVGLITTHDLVRFAFSDHVSKDPATS